MNQVAVYPYNISSRRAHGFRASRQQAKTPVVPQQTHNQGNSNNHANFVLIVCASATPSPYCSINNNINDNIVHPLSGSIRRYNDEASCSCSTSFNHTHHTPFSPNRQLPGIPKTTFASPHCGNNQDIAKCHRQQPPRQQQHRQQQPTTTFAP